MATFIEFSYFFWSRDSLTQGKKDQMRESIAQGKKMMEPVYKMGERTLLFHRVQVASKHAFPSSDKKKYISHFHEKYENQMCP